MRFPTQKKNNRYLLQAYPVCSSVIAHNYYRKLGNVNSALLMPGYTSDSKKGYNCQCIFTAYRYNGE